MKRAQYMIVSVVGIVVLLLIFGSQMFYVLKPGERAVVFKKFTTGLDKDNILIPGFHVLAPWNAGGIPNKGSNKSGFWTLRSIKPG